MTPRISSLLQRGLRRQRVYDRDEEEEPEGVCFPEGIFQIVCFGSQADIRERVRDVRFTPRSRHAQRRHQKSASSYFRVQTSSSHTTSQLQSHVGAPITGSSTPHRRHPLILT